MKKILYIIFFIFLILIAGCTSTNNKLIKKMNEKYSDNQSYVYLSGEVIEVDGNDIIIKCEELKEYINYEDEFCDYVIYSNEILELHIGEQIYFKTVPYHFYNGHKLPIVEIKVKENTILSFDEGKKNLLNWVNTNFK